MDGETHQGRMEDKSRGGAPQGRLTAAKTAHLRTSPRSSPHPRNCEYTPAVRAAARAPPV
jgi:hypothetical protein